MLDARFSARGFSSSLKIGISLLSHNCKQGEISKKSKRQKCDCIGKNFFIIRESKIIMTNHFVSQINSAKSCLPSSGKQNVLFPMILIWLV